MAWACRAGALLLRGNYFFPDLGAALDFESSIFGDFGDGVEKKRAGGTADRLPTILTLGFRNKIRFNAGAGSPQGQECPCQRKGI